LLTVVVIFTHRITVVGAVCYYRILDGCRPAEGLPHWHVSIFEWLETEIS